LVSAELSHLRLDVSFVVADSEPVREIHFADTQFEIEANAHKFAEGAGIELPQLIHLPGDYFIYYVYSLVWSMRQEGQSSLAVCLNKFLELWRKRSVEDPFHPSTSSPWRINTTIEGLNITLRKQGIELTFLREEGVDISSAMLLFSSCS